MAARGIFVTGTDTGVGKTTTSCALLRQLGAIGVRAVAYKPVASGALIVGGQRLSDDARALAACSAPGFALSAINPVLYDPPVSPHIAAHWAGHRPTLTELIAGYQRLATQVDVIVVEGAGGWRSPLDPALLDGGSEAVSQAALALALALPVLLVVGLRLGCLNHARLTYEALQADGVDYAGWIGTELEPNRPDLATMRQTLTHTLGGAEQAIDGLATGLARPSAQAAAAAATA